MECESKGRAKRVRRSDAEIGELVGTYESSGQTQEGFCRERGIHPGTFSSWLRKRRGKEALKAFSAVRLAGGGGFSATISATTIISPPQ